MSDHNGKTASPRNVCCTYPHGERSFLPQVLAFMAVICSVNVFDFFFEHDFLCFKIVVESDRRRELVDLRGLQAQVPANNGPLYTDVFCGPLELNSQDYWDVDDDEDFEGWAGPLRAGAVFGVLAASFGFIAFCSLSSSVCFALPPSRLLQTMVLLGLAAVCQIFTLISGAAKLCSLTPYYDTDNVSCSVRARVEPGAGFAIFGFLFYIAAFGLTFFYWSAIRGESQDDVATSTPSPETHPLVVNTVVQQHPVVANAPKNQKRVEREYTNERGEVIKEIIIQEEEEEVEIPDKSWRMHQPQSSEAINAIKPSSSSSLDAQQNCGAGIICAPIFGSD